MTLPGSSRHSAWAVPMTPFRLVLFGQDGKRLRQINQWLLSLLLGLSNQLSACLPCQPIPFSLCNIPFFGIAVVAWPCNLRLPALVIPLSRCV